ncbi:MAG: UDP-N-acetylmuramoyl-L-alanyl-D-glutamate--2,6-diaminopimelate ligase [Planctomycetota bacterium]|nr:UDP-N-acetylmuramoyl-L-alanyl-D-glutamate--2,6-diaminopimelate ligase [Planctomycetota bacterium]MDA1212925.1 UDP-N-acetylmuramoyl-L-alanyl-D-glutamate--2,6-diaminopimelate ligase [Planctomycetota bacterium]
MADVMTTSVSHYRRPDTFAISLRRLLPGASFVGCADVTVVDATEKSYDCQPGSLFAVVPGSNVDGSRFVGDALQRGASALLVSRPIAGATVPQCVVRNVRRAYAELCSALVGQPFRRLGMIGVTGTNGKTTTTWLIRSILQAAAKKTGLLGTVEYHDGDTSSNSALTTPDSRSLNRWLARMISCRATHAALEVSSHALDQDRVAGIQFDAGVLTNITPDHLDYHRHFESYISTKARIMSLLKASGRMVLNADDRPSAELISRVPTDKMCVTYGIDAPADVTAKIVQEKTDGSRFVLRMRGEEIEVFTSLMGRHNISNCLAAAAAVAQFNLPLEKIAEGIEHLTEVPGRLQRIEMGQPFEVFVDYAHTEDALSRILSALKPLTAGRLICVFGAGGDRDKSKRPLMGRAAAKFADLAVITSDNPRTESPQSIIDQILPGFAESSCQTHIEIDREQAISVALKQAVAGDCVVIAGKGHETEQILGTTRNPFDDREIVRTCLAPLYSPVGTSAANSD